MEYDGSVQFELLHKFYPPYLEHFYAQAIKEIIKEDARLYSLQFGPLANKYVAESLRLQEIRPDKFWEIKDQFEYIKIPESILLVRDLKPLGFIAFHIAPFRVHSLSWMEDPSRPCIYIDYIYVDPKVRNRHLAARLYKRLIDIVNCTIFKDQGIYGVILEYNVFWEKFSAFRRKAFPQMQYLEGTFCYQLPHIKNSKSPSESSLFQIFSPAELTSELFDKLKALLETKYKSNEYILPLFRDKSFVEYWRTLILRYKALGCHLNRLEDGFGFIVVDTKKNGVGFHPLLFTDNVWKQPSLLNWYLDVILHKVRGLINLDTFFVHDTDPSHIPILKEVKCHQSHISFIDKIRS